MDCSNILIINVFVFIFPFCKNSSCSNSSSGGGGGNILYERLCLAVFSLPRILQKKRLKLKERERYCKGEIKAGMQEDLGSMTRLDIN